MSCDASGREGLLTHPGPAVLLSALATCLSDALGLPLVNTPAVPSSLWSAATKKLQAPAPAPVSAQQRTLADCFATQTVAATARILENITTSPRFLVSWGKGFPMNTVWIPLLMPLYLPSKDTGAFLRLLHQPPECCGGSDRPRSRLWQRHQRQLR